MDLDEAMDLMYQCLDETGLAELGWECEFDNAESRFGNCTYSINKTTRELVMDKPHKITLSASITELNDRETVLETILHECAHAMTPGAHHDYEFVMAARSLGISGERCYKMSDVATRTPSWEGRCPNCNRTTHRWRLTKKAQGTSCGACCNEFNNGAYTSRFQYQWNRVDG